MLETLLGAILAIITTIIIESLRKPSLELRVSKIGIEDNYVNRPAKKARFLYIELVNKPLQNGWDGYQEVGLYNVMVLSLFII